jgi:hypothetical protein
MNISKLKLATLVISCGLSMSWLGYADSSNPAPTPAFGASVPCASSGKNAYDTYGLSAFVAVNKSIFANVVNVGATTNPNTPLGVPFTLIGSGNPPSTSDPLPTFEGSLAAFLVWFYGGPTQITYTDGIVYQGPQNMQQSHQGLYITPCQFDYFVTSIIAPALTSNGVSAEDVSSCFAPPLLNPDFESTIVGQ